jgi:hypothetical protein
VKLLYQVEAVGESIYIGWKFLLDVASIAFHSQDGYNGQQFSIG